MATRTHLVESLRQAAQDMDAEAQRRRISAGREDWLKAAASTRLCAVLVSEGVRGYDAATGYAWLSAARDMIREATP